jgi:hypothetical protein
MAKEFTLEEAIRSPAPRPQPKEFSLNEALGRAPQPDAPPSLGAPMGEDFGSSIMAASELPKPPKPTGSVFDTQPFNPEFNPAEAAKLSRRDYAEEAGRPFPVGSIKPSPAKNDIGDIAKGLVTAPLTGFGKGVSTAVRGVGNFFANEAIGNPELAEQGKALEDIGARMYQQEAKKEERNQPTFETSTGQALYGGARSLENLLATYVASGGNPAATLALMSAGTGVGATGEALEKGKGVGTALGYGAGQAALEYATEKMPLGFLAEKLGKEGFKQFIGGFLLRELPSEQIATITQDALQKAVLEPEKTWTDYLKERPEAAYQTLVATGVMAGGVSALNSATGAINNKQREDLANAAKATALDKWANFGAPTQRPTTVEDLVKTLQTPPTPTRTEPRPVTEEATSTPVTSASDELAKKRAEEQKSVLDLEREMEAPEAEKNAPFTLQEAIAPPVTSKPEEDYANKSFAELEALRENADQTNHAMDMAAIEKHLGAEAAAQYDSMNRSQRRKWWEQNATEAIDRDSSTFNGVNEDLLDEYIKAHNNFDTESPRALGRSVGLIARDINDPKFIGSPDFVRLKNALAYATEQGWSEAEVLGGMRERASEWAGADAQELFKDLFKPKPAAAPEAALTLAEEEDNTPFVGEDLTNEPMPNRPEVQTLLDQQAQANKAAEELSKRTAGTSLVKVLQGSLRDSEMSELGGRSRQIGKNPFISLVAKKGTPGSSMEDMVNGGSLNEFLPYDMRPGAETYDNAESAEYIRDKLRQGQYYTYETQRAIEDVNRGIWDLEKLINEELSLDDINKEIQRAFDEQREADLAAEEAAPESKAGVAEPGPAAKTNDELDKREAQLEREAQLNEREARLLDERKRLEEERLKLEAPTKADVAEQEERKAKAAELDEKDQVRKESEAGADQFELTREEGRQDTTGNLFDQPAAEPEVVEVSTEQERKEALEQFERQISVPIPPFRAKSATKTQLLKPTPLTKPLLKEVSKIASDALDLGLPAAVLGNVTAAGSTRLDARAVMSGSGWLMLAKHWKASTPAEKLQAFVHELGHSVDFEGKMISSSANWTKAHKELKNWYDSSANKVRHPLAYPFSPQFKGQVHPEQESFAQAFSYYFTSPVDLQTNAPEAYSQIQAIIERIQDGSQKARAAGTTERGTTGIKVQPARVEKGTAVQPNAGEVGTAISSAQGLEDRSAGKPVTINAVVGNTVFNQRPLVNWTAPEFTDKDKFIYHIQNRHIDTKRVVDEIAKSIGVIDDRWNPYLMEELFHGRAAKQTKDFLVNELRPLLREMDRLGITIADLEEYLHNKHAEERNKQVAKVNPTMPDGGSGIDTADARAYLAALTPEQKNNFDQVNRMVKVITGNTRQMLVDSGLESQDTIDTWEKTYGEYVPLNRDDVDYSSNQGQSVGQGYSVRGASSKRAAGSTRKVVDILANIAMQRERTIVRAEKNRVATALYGLALKNPNPKFWVAVNPDSKKDMQATINELVNMGLTAQDALNLMKEPTQTVIDPKTGLVTQRVNPILRGADNVMAVRVDGKDRFVFFNQNNERANRMVTALKNLDADQLGWVMSNMAKGTRYFASINTQYNPVFGVYNFLRDMEGATLQLTNTALAGKQTEVMKNVMPAIAGIYSQLRADHQGKVSRGQWSKLWEEFQQQGGQTGFRDQFSRSEERGRALERELQKMSQGKVNQAKDKIFDWLSDYNETMENAVRLAAYKAALDNNLSKEKAASLAKNLTVNFNRKGQISTQAGALYAFFNSAVQGTTRLGQTLTGPAGKTIIAGGFILGSIQAALLAGMGFGDDDPPDFVKDKNFIIPLMNGKYLAIPMPLGYNVIPSTARILTEGAIDFAQGKKVNAPKRLEHMMGLLLDAFNPIGNAGWSAQTFTPTLGDPIVALLENKDWTGKPIAKEDFNKLDPTPGYMRAKETASIFGKKISEFMNYASGGTKDAPGIFSPTPDQIDYLIGQATGGLGREALKASSTVQAIRSGEELPPHKIPLVGRFYGDIKGSSSVANHFYENIKKMNEYENTVKGMRERRENVQQLYKENPEARAYQFANEVEREVQKLRKLRHSQVEKNAPKETVQYTEKRITYQMKRLNDRIESLEKKRSLNED